MALFVGLVLTKSNKNFKNTSHWLKLENVAIFSAVGDLLKKITEVFSVQAQKHILIFYTKFKAFKMKLKRKKPRFFSMIRTSLLLF